MILISSGGTAGAAFRIVIAQPRPGGLIGRRAGQRIARSELAERTFWQRILNWLGLLPQRAGHVVPGGWFGLIALAILLVLAITLVVFWVRPARRGRDRTGSVFTAEPKTARDYRRAAERLATEGRYADAIVESVRAIAAELEERAILAPRPGRTAGELATESGRELPGLAADLRTAAQLFDDVRYGDRDGTLAGYRLVRRIDEQVRSARPAASPAAEPALAGFGVPR